MMAMNDYAIAGMLLAFLVGLAIAAPIWGVDSRDGVESDQPSRRVSWMYDREAGHSSRSAGVALAGTLRSIAYHLDAEAATESYPDQRLAKAC